MSVRRHSVNTTLLQEEALRKQRREEARSLWRLQQDPGFRRAIGSWFEMSSLAGLWLWVSYLGVRGSGVWVY